MRVMLSACTNKAFLCGPMPLAHLKLRPLIAVNDNNAVFSPPKSSHPFHVKRAAYGRAEFIIAMLVAVAGIITLPLLQGFVVPVMTASEETPKVLRGNPVSPNLIQTKKNG